MNRALVALGLSGAIGASASAEVLLSYGFTDLSGSFTRGAVAGEGAFRAEAVDAGTIRTSGDVTRLVGPGGTANFDVGFQSRSAFANAVFDINVTNNNGNTADGQGEFVITDADGDTLSGGIMGTWVRTGNNIYFNGLLLGVVFSDEGQQDGTFDGVDGGSFGMDLPGTPPYDGAYIQLFILPGNNFFQRTFRSVSVQANGEIIPAPAAMALLGVAGVFSGCRRR